MTTAKEEEAINVLLLKVEKDLEERYSHAVVRYHRDLVKLCKALIRKDEELKVRKRVKRVIGTKDFKKLEFTEHIMLMRCSTKERKRFWQDEEVKGGYMEVLKWVIKNRPDCLYRLGRILGLSRVYIGLLIARVSLAV